MSAFFANQDFRLRCDPTGCDNLRMPDIADLRHTLTSEISESGF